MKSDTFCEYVKVCPTYGPGFFYIPGSDTCLKVGGNVWFEANYSQPFFGTQNSLGTRSSLKVSLDARTNTEYGLLRTVVEPQVSHRTGSDNSGTAAREGLTFTGNSYNAGGVNGLGIGSDGKQTQFNTLAYIQFGGLTAGHMPSFFSTIFPQTNIGLDGWDQRDLTNTVGYTFSLGNGITLTGALEDGTLVNRNGIYDASYTRTAGGYGYGSNKLPDYVANIAADQAWGKVVLSGMVHTINTRNNEVTSLLSAASPATAQSVVLVGKNAGTVGTQYGWSAQLATKVNLPMIANGDYLFLSGLYSVANNQVGLRNSTSGDATNQSTSCIGIGRVAITCNDLVIDANGGVHKPKVWGAAAEFNHQFTPTVGTYLGASYTSISWDSVAQASASSLDTVGTAINPANLVRVNLGLVWTPVKGFKITPDVEWAQISTKVANHNGTPTGVTVDTTDKKKENIFISRVKIQRDF